MNKVDFKTSNYFPGYIYYTGFLFIGLGLSLLALKPVMGIILCFVGLIIVTTQYRLAVDLHNKIYDEYVWILGFRSGDKGKFNTVEYLFIKKSTVSQTMHVQVVSSSIQKEVYAGYLKFSETEKLHLLTLDNKESLIKKLKSIADQLKTRIVDYSDGQANEV